MLQPSALLRKNLIECFRDELKISLTFIDVFIQNCIKLIDVEKKKVLEKDLISDEALQFEKYKERVLGCQTKCPSCGRMCDVEHYKVSTPIGSETNKHQCMRGHQFRGMNGFKMKHSNEPSFRICESAKDDEKIQFSGRYISWKEYKTKHPAWSFEVDSQQDVKDWQARCVFIWSKIGKELCDHFGMTYTSLAIDPPVKIADPIHFVLVLDHSISMEGVKWKALIHSVTNFLQVRYSEGNPEDRVSIVFFSGEASIKVFSQPIHPSIIEQYELAEPKEYRWTNFNAALEKVIQVMHNAKNATDLRKFGIVFMSDGEASYPSDELLEIKSNWLNRIYNFWCIGFGYYENFKVLREMCTFVNGEESSFLNPQDQLALDIVYAEIAREE